MAPYTVVDTPEALQKMLRSILDAQESLDESESPPPLLYVDIEGDNLCRDGTISLIQMHIPEIKKTFILDVFVLGEDTFTTSIDPRFTLKSVLESPTILKCFFDVRADSDALYNLYGVSMAGVIDVQLMENATRPGSKRYLNGLARAIREDAGLNRGVVTRWLDVKDRGKQMFKGSSDFKAFEIRPLPPVLLEYCINDVIHLPQLWEVYNQKLNSRWSLKVKRETVARVQLAKRATYFGGTAAGPSWI